MSSKKEKVRFWASLYRFPYFKLEYFFADQEAAFKAEEELKKTKTKQGRGRQGANGWRIGNTVMESFVRRIPRPAQPQNSGTEESVPTEEGPDAEDGEETSKVQNISCNFFP